MNIREIQKKLADLGFNSGPVDGVNGPKTKSAVRQFQEKYGLVVDGIPGRQTQAALKQALKPADPCRSEPDKSAMGQTLLGQPSETGDEDISDADSASGSAPPNVSNLRLLDTARRIDEIINHCAATPEGKDFTVNDIRAWHKARGFSDVGYHYVVYRDGRIMLGRPVGQIGAHTKGHNTGTIGISYIGGVTADGKSAKDTRTKAQKRSLLWLNKKLATKFNVTKITGHNQYAAKACPSFDVRKDPLGAIV